MIPSHFMPIFAAASSSKILIMMIVSGVGSTLLVFGVLYFLMRKPKPQSEDDEIMDENGIFGPLTPGLANAIPENEKENREFRQILRQAGFYSLSARNSIYAARLVLFLLPLFAGLYAGVLFPDLMLQYALMGLFVGTTLSIIPRLYVYWVRKRRMEHIRLGIPDTMDMFGMCASGGMTMNESLEHIADQIYEYPELSQELCILRRQIELGSLDDAVKDLMERVNLPEMRQFSYLLLRSSQLGNQSNTALNEQADHLRAMRRHHAMAQANKTPTKLVFPLMFCFAPAALILMLSPSLMTIYDFMSSKEVSQQESLQNTIEANGPKANFNIQGTSENGSANN